jgi:hypothetical protein
MSRTLEQDRQRKRDLYGYGQPDEDCTPEQLANREMRKAKRRRTVRDYASAEDSAALDAGESKAWRRTNAAAATAGYAPSHGWVNPVPEPHVAKGVSTLYGADGEPRIQWVKSSLSEQRAADIQRLTVQELCNRVERAELIQPPPIADDDLLNVYLLGDPHIGMLAWAQETLGADWDLKIAQRTHQRAMRLLVAGAPKAARSLVANMGDALHADNYDYLTQSGHRLDADSRLPRAISVAVQTFRTLGELALAASQTVTWLNVSGNHDRNAAPWFDEVLKAYWHNNSRMIIETSPASNLYHRFGKVLLGFTHGDRLKGRFAKRNGSQDFLAVMAHDSPDWSDTTTHACFQGHIHSANEIEGIGGTLMSVQTLASNDAWHAAQKYRSGKSMTRITYHRKWGEISRGRVPVEMVL